MFNRMQALRGIALALLLAWPAWGQLSFSSKSARKTKARLVLSHEIARPGDTVTAGLELTMDAGWHTYWQNGGDSGEATRLFWSLPDGISAGPIEWPVPEKLVAGDLVTYVFHDRAVLLVPLKIPENVAPGVRELKVLVKWLECEKVCVPGSNLVSASLTIGSEAKPTADAAFFEDARRKLPAKTVPGPVAARWDQPPGSSRRALIIEWNTDATAPDFLPFTNALAIIEGKTEVLSAAAGKILLRKTAEKLGDAWPQEIAGLLVRKEGNANVGYEVSVPIAESAPAGATPGSAGVSSGGARSLWAWLGYAFIGGLILNIMPCVLPVIALKILGFVNQSREHPKRVRLLGVIYTLGVIASFLVLAGIVIGVKAAGQKAGWGMQFSNPQFIVILTVIVTLVALNLFGVFEITLSGRALDAANEAASRHGTAGAFMNGVLATVLATPCTAPFLGAALGFAFAQSAAIIVLFFITIALGLATPYLVLSWNPAWLKLLPKPGAWMERFKVAMGFPMLATAVWLFTLTIVHYGKRVWWLGAFLVVVALAAWVFGEFVQRGRTRRGVALAIVLVLLLGGYAYAVERQLQWRSALAESPPGGIIQEGKDGIAWQRWSPEAVAKARAEARPVFVDFTADWCVTCEFNKKTSIEIPSVRAKLKEINAVPLLGDYTKLPPAISAELEKFGRAGVPLVLVYPRDASKPPVALPEILTAGIVLKALNEAAK